MRGCRTKPVIKITITAFINFLLKPALSEQKILCHTVYDVKTDRQLIAGGHLIPVPNEGVYSAVVSLHGIQIVVTCAELNDLLLGNADNDCAHLKAKKTIFQRE
jgi:hypothetical protein